MLINNKYISVKINESQIRERNRELSILLEVSNLLSTSLNLQTLLTKALSKVMTYFDLDTGRIYIVNDGDPYLYLATHQGIETEGLEKLSLNEGFSGKAARNKCFIAQHVSELEDRDRAALLSKKGLKVIICVPLISMDKVGGVMNLGSKKIVQLDQGKIDLLTAIGNQIAIAADNVKYYEDLQNKIKKLNEKQETIKFFTYSVSHDLKSPAIGIYGLTKRFHEKYVHILDEKGKAYCKQILTAAKQMVDLVEKINEYIAAKEAPYHFEEIKAKDIIDLIRDEFSLELEQRQIRWSESDNLTEIIADRLALIRVFRNFVDNALKYGGNEMLQLKIGYKENEKFHIFSVSDDGVGIKTEERGKLFKKFQREETSLGKKGSGLGLAIVKEIAESHGGRAWVDGNTNVGTTFCISISKDLRPENKL